MRIEEYCKANNAKEPEIGMGCTIHYYSDADPATIVRMSKSKKTIWIRKNKCNHIGVAYENRWDILDELQGEEIRCSLRKDGRYREARHDSYIQLDIKHKYYDYSF